MGPLLSPNRGYPILGDFEETAQERTVRCNIQPVTQLTGFSDFQTNEENYSDQPTVAPLIFPLSSLMHQHRPLGDTDSFNR